MELIVVRKDMLTDFYPNHIEVAKTTYDRLWDLPYGDFNNNGDNNLNIDILIGALSIGVLSLEIFEREKQVLLL